MLSATYYNSPMPHFSPAERRALDVLARDLERVFGRRLRTLVAYHGHHADGPVHSCAIVDGLSFADLAACLPLADVWHRHNLAVPLLLTDDELRRTLDTFPLEYGGIIADHALIRGDDVFARVAVSTDELRRACDSQAKSHLIHLREGFLESHGEVRAIARLIARSATPLRALLTSLARLAGDGSAAHAGTLSDESLAAFAERRIGVSGTLVRAVFVAAGSQASTIVEPSGVLARYLDAAERICAYVEGWQDVKDSRRTATAE